ncbi:hypothetical protein XMA152_001766 [Marinobacterium sp. xm-a-152]|nr:hypothetical protein [Marinobacterium sp. xm-a-152]
MTEEPLGALNVLVTTSSVDLSTVEGSGSAIKLPVALGSSVSV